MKLQVRTHNCALSGGDEPELRRHIDQLEPELARYDPDLVHLEVVLEKQARRQEFTGQLRLVVMEQVLAARRNAAPSLRTLLNEAFEDLREQLGRMHAHLRLEPERERKRGMRSEEAFQDADRLLIELRAALDRALGQGGADFEVLADTRLPGVRRVIFDLLTEDGRRPTDDELDRALLNTLATAHEDLRSKPEGWSLFGWLAWVARRELGRAARTV